MAHRRDCIDDGALWALLLGPLLSAAMLLSTLGRLQEHAPTSLPSGWMIEEPLVLDSTPSHLGHNLSPRGREPATLALSALALSRRQLTQMNCLLSAILLIHLVWSQRSDLRHADERRLAAEAIAQNGGQGTSAAMQGASPPWIWARTSEWRRTWSIVTFSFLLTAASVATKAALNSWRPEWIQGELSDGK